jgi:hypothetical protein
MQIPQSECVRRRRETLAEWMAWGHSETDLRALAKAVGLPLAPIGQGESMASDPHALVKRRSPGKKL